MIKKLQHIFALSEKGAKDLVKAVIWCFVCNLALMFPVGAVLFTVQHLLGCLEGGSDPNGGVLALCGLRPGGAGSTVRPSLVPVRLSLHRHLPGERQPPGELAETLRRLPLSFFGEP